MGKNNVVIILTKNDDHSNVLSKKLREIEKTMGGLDIIGKSGVPVSIAYQGYNKKKWLKKIREYANIKLISAPFSHSLFPIIENNDSWEFGEGFIPGDMDVTFFPEFANPIDPERIPTEFFLVLEPHSTGNFSSEYLGVKCGNKTGILMRGYQVLLKLFFAFQTEPNQETLKNLLDEVERIKKMPGNNLIIWPIDLEAPWVGSKFGMEIWKRFFKGIKERGLESVFTSLEKSLDLIKSRSVKGPVPQRDLPKWTQHTEQKKRWEKLKKIYPRSRREEMILSLAGGSDYFSAFLSKHGKEVLIDAVDKTGRKVKISIGYNPDVLTVKVAAYETLIDGGTLLKRLERLDKSSFYIQTTIEFAKENEL